MALRKTDAQLLADTAQNADAFGEFYRRHAEPVLAYLLYRTGDAHHALDLTAEVFAVALEARGRYEAGRGPARAWLLGIARNLVADSFRRREAGRRARMRLGIEPLAFEDDELARVEELIDLERTELPLTALLADLPDDELEAVRARVIDEEDYSRIAEREGVSGAVIRKRVSRGLGRLGGRLMHGDRPPTKQRTYAVFAAGER